MIGKQPLISVIVPVYNGEDYLSKCIDSIEAQSYSNLEIIIINDGSTDQTARVCGQIKKKYENTHVIFMEDKGVSAARNAGLDGAKGEYITFVDADDRLFPDMLEKLYDCLVSTGSDVAGCGFVEWQSEAEWIRLTESRQRAAKQQEMRKEQNRAAKQQEMRKEQSQAAEQPGMQKEQSQAAEQPGMQKRKRQQEVRVYNSREFMEECILKGNSRCWSKLYKRETIDKLRFREGLNIGEDMLFLVDLLPLAGRLAEIDEKGYGYYKNPAGAMKRKFTPAYMAQITCWELAEEKLRQIFKLEDKEGRAIISRLTSIQITSIMLTAGKIAVLSGKERKQNSRYIEACHEKLKKAMEIPEAFQELSKGYQIKTKLFYLAPHLYLRLYHFSKYKK